MWPNPPFCGLGFADFGDITRISRPVIGRDFVMEYGL
jgi:hypothetical protein